MQKAATFEYTVQSPPSCQHAGLTRHAKEMEPQNQSLLTTKLQDTSKKEESLTQEKKKTIFNQRSQYRGKVKTKGYGWETIECDYQGGS